MIILGDIAIPTIQGVNILTKTLALNPNIFNNKLIICNFEGLISKSEFINKNEPILYNFKDVLKSLKNRGPVVTCLANNHILDLPKQFLPTLKHFKEFGIQHLGCGKDFYSADTPLTVKEEDQEIILFNSCWSFLLYNQKNPTNNVHVSTINTHKLIEGVKRERKQNSSANIVVYLHWSLDLEILPFPMYRKFAKTLIDNGANVVVGSHSHCVQGGECYKNGIIVYGLGNFFIQNGVYANGKISYPNMANIELVLEYETKNKHAICHWFEMNKINELKHIKSDDFDTSVMLKRYSPFQNMGDAEYYKYFKKHRRKKLLIPIYNDINKKFTNRFYDIILKYRALIARRLAKFKIINWQN